MKPSKLKSVSVNDVITHMTVLSPRSKDEINLKLKNCLNVLRDDLEAIERVAKEITEDASRNGLKYFEVGVDPTKFISESDAGGSSPSSTEILTESSQHWTTVGSLPSPRSGLRGVNIDNRVFITGRTWQILIPTLLTSL